MATATKEQKEKDDAEFAEQFAAPDAVKKEPTEDEAFGLTDPAPNEADGATTDNGAAAADASTAAADTAGAADAAPQETDAEKALREREDALKAKEAELAQKEAELAAKSASIETTNAGESQSSREESPDHEAGETADEEAAEESDPGKALADDFGPDFVDLLTRFIKKICATEVGNGLGSVSATVDAVIHHLQSERQANHFKAIKAAHDDFQEIVESPEFSAWKESQSPEKQSELQRVIDSGSAQEIIDMLTDFKQSRGGGSTVDESALDDAEGVRSGGGLTLPKEPAASDDYAKAWEES